MSSRKRAMLACTHCHQIKVRCDAYSLGSPCTRCREDGATCVLRQGRTRRVPAIQMIRQQEGAQNAPASDLSQERLSNECSQESFFHYAKCPFLNIGETSPLDPADLMYLAAKGCMQVPTFSLLEDFMKQFFMHVQPFTPLMDESMFWNMYEGKPTDGQPRQIHLLLFQAMLFASSPYISKRTLEKCGFQDHRSAWTTLYQKAKLLYNSPLKIDPITRAQSALLLTFYTCSDEPQTANLWLSHAIQSATHASPKPQERTPDEPQTVQTSLYDRLWCSILLRDRIISLGLRRRPQVLSFEMNLINSIPEETAYGAEIQGSRVYDPSTRRVLFIAFRDLCQLAILLSEILSLMYGHDCLTLPILPTQEFHNRLALVNNTQTLLGLWKANSEILNYDGEVTHSSILRCKHLATAYYQGARSHLAHYQVLLIKKHESYLNGDYSRHIDRAGQILSDATVGIITTMEYFSASAKAQNPPLSLLGYLAMPLVLSAIDFKLATTTSAMRNRRRILEHLGGLISQLRRVYVIADNISFELDKILHLAYYTSSKVFRQGVMERPKAAAPQVGPFARIAPKRTPFAISSSNWREAFLRHTGVYLWISTTVDYYFSVGRMPRLDVPADYYSCVSPSDMLQIDCRPNPDPQVEGIICPVTPPASGSQAIDNPADHPGSVPDGGGPAVELLSLGSITLGLETVAAAIVSELVADEEEFEKGHRSCQKRLDLDFFSFDD